MHRTICPFVSSCAVLAAFAVLAAPVSGARAEEAPPVLVHDVGAYALFGRSAVVLNGAASMPVHTSIGSETSVELSLQTIATGENSYVAAPLVIGRDASEVHAVFTDLLDTSPGVVVFHASVPLGGRIVDESNWPHAPEITCGGASIVVDSSTSPLTLAPGRYDTITVQQDQTLTLVAGGRYELCSMKLRSGATVEAHAGTFVLLRDYLTADGRTRITGDGACGARWIAAAKKLSPAPGGSGFEFIHRSGAANRSLIEGQFFTNGRIWLGQNVDYVGRLWGERIDGFGSNELPRTVADCRSAQCGDGNLDAGESCDDGNNLDGDCCSAFCEVLPPGAACDDGLFCTTGDVCSADARCIGSGSPCDAPDGDANCSEQCNEDTDRCDAPDPDGSPCDDGVYCNGADLCASGGCISHSGSPCAGLDGDTNCREGCVESTHRCDGYDPPGAPCSDGRFCTVGESCDGLGTCTGGTSPCPEADGDADCAESCDELADACDASDAEASPCNDGLFCTATDQCDGRGHCQSWGDPCANAAGDGDSDCSEACDEGTDACSAPDRDGAPCSDGLACTVGERCLSGVCAPGGLTSCDDSNPCTDEFCAPDGSCLRDYNAIACDDGNACTTGDRCQSGSCTGTAFVDCRDDDLCSTDVCDPADGICHHSYAPSDACHVSGKSRTSIELGYLGTGGEVAGRLTTSWRGNPGEDSTAREELGDPSLGDSFAVCFYDETSGVAELAYRLDFNDDAIEGGSWRRKGGFFDLLYRLKAADGTSQGVSALRLGVDRDGVPKMKLVAGANAGCSDDCRAKFAPPPRRPDGRLFAMEPGMTVQWTASTGACWSSRYESAAVNTPDAFQARAR
ncbi:MAG TPA: hypothetical protein VN634_18240 [Candidatus Limnocylindrales bacterium]|nr:hypothetical protein [Candidatus Limnocylindrales bacterium]